MEIFGNLKASQAYKGQSVTFTIDPGGVDINHFSIGQVYISTSNGKQGIVVSVDNYGNSFKISPLSPAERFDGSSVGIFNEFDTINN